MIFQLSDHTETHFFEINTRDCNVKLIPAANPTCLPDFIIPINSSIGSRTRSEEEKQLIQKNEYGGDDNENEGEIQEEEENNYDDDDKGTDSEFENHSQRSNRKGQVKDAEVNPENPN